MALKCAPPPPAPSAYSVFLFNQSGRAYDCAKDASYLMGNNPDSKTPTYSLLGPYIGSYSNYECNVVDFKLGSTLLWSSIYVKWVWVEAE